MTDEGDDPNDSDNIDVGDIEDNQTKELVQQLLKERDEMSSELSNARKHLEEFSQKEEEREKQEKRDELISKLESSNKSLAEKYKDESSIERLEMLVELSEDMSEGDSFPEYSSGPSEGKDDQLPVRISLETGKPTI